MPTKKTLTQEEIVAALASNPALAKVVMGTLKETGVLSTKKEVVIVAQRHQVKDSGPQAKTARKAGDVTDMTEKSLDATLKTWIRGKDADTKLPLVKASILGGHREDFGSFYIQGVVRA